ncbi:MAG: helix-turn-helix transcriptional regulator [Pseudomonadota bacterium]
MITEFALDLRHARRKSGLSQEEVAYLVDISQSSYSRFEKGTLTPSVDQLCLLSLIYGKSFVSYFEAITKSLKPGIAMRIANLPPKSKPRLRIFNRARTLEKLRRRVTMEHGSA